MRYTDVSHRTWAVPLRLVALLVSMIVFSPWAWAEEGTGEAPQATGTTAPETAPGEATGSAASEAASAEATDAEAGAPHADFVSTKNIEDKLREAKAPRKSVLDFGLQDALRRVDDRIYQKTHLRFAAIYTLLYQHAYGGDGPRDAAGGDFDLIGTWDAIRCGKRTTGALEVAFEGRHKIETDITPSALSRTIDSLWTTTSGFNKQDFSLIQAYWRQDLLRDRLHFRVGKLSASSTFFGNRINSSSLFFLNYAFSDNPAVFFPGNGLGLHVTWDLSPAGRSPPESRTPTGSRPRSIRPHSASASTGPRSSSPTAPGSAVSARAPTAWVAGTSRLERSATRRPGRAAS